MRPYIKQGVFFSKFINYLNIEKNANKTKNLKPISDERKKEINKGLCRGFSIVHSYMAAKGQSAWWESVLQIVSGWDGTEATLDDEVYMPAGTFLSNSTLERSTAPGQVKSTYKKLLYRVSNYVLYNFGITRVSGIPNINQDNFLKPDGPFVSMDGGIQFYQSFAGHFDNKLLSDLLDSLKHAPPLEAVIMIESPGKHACSLRYGGEEWYLYDPNYPSGEKCFNKPDLLIKEVFRILGQDLCIEVASWQKESPESGLTQVVGHASKFYSAENSNTLIQKCGLHAIARRAPTDRLSNIIAMAQMNDELKASLAEALKTKNNNNRTGLSMIARCAPGQLAAIIAMAQADTREGNALKASLAEALNTKNNDNWTGLHMIARYAPGQLAALIAMAQTDDELKASLAEALKTKNNNNVTGLHMIARHAPDQLTAVVEMAQANTTENNVIKASLAEAIKSNGDLKSTYAVYAILHIAKIYKGRWINELEELSKKLHQSTGPQKNNAAGKEYFNMIKTSINELLKKCDKNPFWTSGMLSQALKKLTAQLNIGASMDIEKEMQEITRLANPIVSDMDAEIENCKDEESKTTMKRARTDYLNASADAKRQEALIVFCKSIDNAPRGVPGAGFFSITKSFLPQDIFKEKHLSKESQKKLEEQLATINSHDFSRR